MTLLSISLATVLLLLVATIARVIIVGRHDVLLAVAKEVVGLRLGGEECESSWGEGGLGLQLVSDWVI